VQIALVDLRDFGKFHRRHRSVGSDHLVEARRIT
jgi:hypothetical protein